MRVMQRPVYIAAVCVWLVLLFLTFSHRFRSEPCKDALCQQQRSESGSVLSKIQNTYDKWTGKPAQVSENDISTNPQSDINQIEDKSPHTDTQDSSFDIPTTHESDLKPVADENNEIEAPSENTEGKWPQVHLPDDTSSDTPSNADRPQLHKGELVMITGSFGNGGYLGVPGLKEQVYENRRAYAERWGHEFIWANLSSYEYQPMQWNKLSIVKEAMIRFPAAKWFWWIDTDIIIMNITVDMHSLVLSNEGMAKNLLYDTDIPSVGGGTLGFRTPTTINPDDIDMLIAFDTWGMNTGSFLFRRSSWSDLILDIWSDPLLRQQGWVFHDQDGWIHIFKNHELVRNHTGIVRQAAINAYNHYNMLGVWYKPGDLLAHFPGCGGRQNFTPCRDHWDEYWERREPYQEYDWIRQEIENGTAPIEGVQSGVF